MPHYSRSVTCLLMALALTTGVATLVAAGSINFLTSDPPTPAGDGKDTRAIANRSKQETRRELAGARRLDNANGLLSVRAAPFVTETKLIASDGVTGNKLGSAVAVSGNTLIVGDDTSVYVFVRSNGIWMQQQELSAPGNPHLAIDGNTLVAAGGNTFRVFLRNGGVWTSQQVVALDSVTPASSVAISGDTIIVGIESDFEGCPEDSVGGRGAALVFVRNGTSWTLQQKLTASDGQCSYEAMPGVGGGYIHYGDQFGHSVSISGDTILVGAYAANTGASLEAGAAYVFGRSGATWTQQQRLTASDVSINDYFGFSVAISNDTAAIGAIGAGVGPYQPGFAYAFGRSNGTWTEQQKFTANVPPDSLTGFGYSVAATGDTIVVGCDSDQPAQGVGSPGPLGSAYWYKRSGPTWIEQPKLMASDGAQGDSFGRATAISGATIVVGAYGDDTTGGPDAGSAYVFEDSADTVPPTLTVPANITTNATSTNGAVVQYLVTATDSVDPNPIVVSIPPPGSLFAIGSTTVRSTATDASGNSASATFTVNVQDAAPTPPPPPNPCVGPPLPPTTGTLRKSVALGPAPARDLDAFGKEQDLLYKYKPSESLCPTDPGQLEGQDLLDWNQSNIGLLKESGTTWVKLWVDWATLEPYSPAKLREMASDPRQEVRDFGETVIARKENLLKNLDKQIRTAHKEKLQVILTVNHSYPFWVSYVPPDLLLPLPPNPSRDAQVPGCDLTCKLKHDGKRRDPFARVPMDLGITSPWALWIRTLIDRYGLTKAKIYSRREVCSQNFQDARCGDYLNYVDFLEIVNEPNYTLWPQRSPDKKSGRLVIARDVAQMFKTAKTILEFLNLILIEHGQLDSGATTLNLLGPATSDYPISNYRRTSYDEFNSELLRNLQGFTPGRNFGWSHHNYGDVEGANGYANKFGHTKSASANSTAWTRRLMVGKWAGWPSGDGRNPEILITESGARLDFVAKKWKLSLSNVPILKYQQAALVGENFNQMDKSSLGKGVAMVNNYLTYTDPAYDTGLLDFRGTLADWQRRACGVNRVTQQPIACRTDTGLNGDRRLVYSAWKAVQPSR